MIKYLLAFSVYTLAMIGVIVIALIVWKNSILNTNTKKKGTIKVEESLSLNPRKTLYVIKIKDERFLIAADVDKTTFLAKLKDGESIVDNSYSNNPQEPLSNLNNQGGEVIELEKRPAMRNILKELTKKRMDDV